MSRKHNYNVSCDAVLYVTDEQHEKIQDMIPEGRRLIAKWFRDAYLASQAAPEESIAPETLRESEDVKPEEGHDLTDEMKSRVLPGYHEGRQAERDYRDDFERRVAATNALALRVQQANDAAARTLLDMKRRVGDLECDVKSCPNIRRSRECRRLRAIEGSQPSTEDRGSKWGGS